MFDDKLLLFFIVLLAIPDDTKALFRRCQAHRELERLDDAMQDAKRLMQIDARNKESVDLMQALNKLILQKQSEQRSTKSKAKNMLDLARDERGEKQKTALNNLIVLAKEEAGSNEIITLNGLATIKEILGQDTENEENVLAITRILSSLVKGSFKRVNGGYLFIFH
jgi:hypothetical protein